MANASTRDARTGFAIYLQSAEGIHLDELNARLERSGYRPVAQRTLNHYRNLVNAGFNRYISINRFDVARASRAYENMSSLGRYRYRSTHQDVEMIFTKGSRLCQADGHIVEVGDVGAIIEFSSEEAIQNLRRFKPTPRDVVILHYPNQDDAVKGRVIEADVDSYPAVVEIEHAKLTSVADTGNATPLPTSIVQFTLMAEDHDRITIDVLGRRLHHFFDLIEGVRALVNEAGRHSDADTYAPPPIVTEIRLASPAVLLLQMSTELLPLVSSPLVVGLLFTTLRKQWHEGSLHKRQGQLVDAEKEIKQLDREAKQQENEIRAEVIENVRTQLPQSNISSELVETIVDTSVLPSLKALAGANIRAIDVTTPDAEDNDTEQAEAERRDDDESE